MKKLTDALGKARDQDVAITTLEKLRDNAQNDCIKTDLTKKVEKRRIVREETQKELVKILDTSSLESLRENFSKALDEASEKNEEAAKLTPKEAGQAVISKGLQEFSDLSGSLYNPFNPEKLHQLRISAKRLRYALELFTLCWSEQMSPFAKKVADLQTYLGELHDCDIWIESLSQHLNKKKIKKQRTDFWLLSKFTKNRTKNYRAALRLWSKWQKNKFIERLQEVLQTD